MAAVELNVSCPNVSHGLDLGIDPAAVGTAREARVRAGVSAAGDRQTDAECHGRRRDRPAAADGRGGCREPGQHLSRHGGQLAAPAAPSWPTTSAG